MIYFFNFDFFLNIVGIFADNNYFLFIIIYTFNFLSHLLQI
jgi:hypothetical protein